MGFRLRKKGGDYRDPYVTHETQSGGNDVEESWGVKSVLKHFQLTQRSESEEIGEGAVDEKKEED